MLIQQRWADSRDEAGFQGPNQRLNTYGLHHSQQYLNISSTYHQYRFFVRVDVFKLKILFASCLCTSRKLRLSKPHFKET